MLFVKFLQNHSKRQPWTILGLGLLSLLYSLMLVACGDSNYDFPANSTTEAGKTTSGATSNKTEQAKINPCALVTKSDVEAFMGGPVTA